jgi:thiol:disulfide interchange protein DsbC
MYKKLLSGLMISATLFATTGTVIADEATENTLKEKMITMFKKAPTSIGESQVPGVYEVSYGFETLYISADGKYFFNGDMIELDTRKNITEANRSGARKAVMDKYDASKMIAYKAKDEKHVLTVFTDIDCPYCAKIHNEVPKLNEKGVTVQYMLYPRAGLGSASYKKAVSSWCADNPQEALTKAKNRESIPDKTCDNPIADQYQLGGEIGVTGTPALVTESGSLIPGYVPADRLVKMLEQDSKS